jgi:transposase
MLPSPKFTRTTSITPYIYCRKSAQAVCLAAGIVRRSDKAQGFELLPHRWIIERTFGWLGRYRRLSRDFEHTVSSSKSVVYIASIRRMLRLATI